MSSFILIQTRIKITRLILLIIAILKLSGRVNTSRPVTCLTLPIFLDKLEVTTNTKGVFMTYSIVKKDYTVQSEDGRTDELMTELVRAVKETEIKGVFMTLPRALKIAEQVRPVFEEHGKFLYSNTTA